MKTALTVICLLSISTAIFASPPPSVTRASGPEGALLTLEVKKNVYIGNRTFDVELGLSNSAGVSELILEDTAGLNPPCRERLEKVVLSGKELTFKRKFKMADIKGDVCDKQKDIIAFDMVIVRFHDGKIEKLSPFIFGFSKELTRQVGTYYEHEIKPVKITANLTAEQAGTIIEYDTTLETKARSMILDILLLLQT
ncbi:MAG: hypothetical protein IPK04_12725 [Bdellovibrionales bacterium]|nr:hypothetical protein [Bdellovibrionales bacterium]